MEVLAHDIAQTLLKLTGKSEYYEENTESLHDKEVRIAQTTWLNTHMQLSKYLAQAQGRQRCHVIMNMSRRDLLKAERIHQRNQLTAYQDLLTAFTSVRGLLGGGGGVT